MAPRIESLAQSESKTRFMERLRLSSESEHDNRIYSMKVRGMTSSPGVVPRVLMIATE